MKNLKTLLAVGLLALLTSCSATKESTATKTESNRGRSNEIVERTATNERTKTTTSPEFSSTRTVSTGAVKYNAALDSAKMQEMYSTLNMDDAQIKRFETEWKSSTGAWKRSNRDKEMNNFERIEYQDRILKNILDESQFEEYQEWARENPRQD